ncbi:hypothetical protein GQ53DRAFT_656990, partial [Thozetella sp. PMI_491]
TCTTTETQTWYSTAGCNYTCSTGACYADAAVTLKCGCDRMQVVTRSTTVCATRSSCYQCTTGWGIATIKEACSSAPTPGPLPTNA